MEKQREHYNNLYNEYKILKNKTTLEAHALKPGGKIQAQSISVKDLERRLEVQKELLNGLDFLSDHQLIELSGDHFFSKKAQFVLMNRRMAE